MAAFSAWLSSRMAPSTERSASRLFGKGFSRMVSAAMAKSVANSLFVRPSLDHTLPARASPFPPRVLDHLQVARVALLSIDRLAGLDQILFDCLNRRRIVRAVAARVNRSGCAGL